MNICTKGRASPWGKCLILSFGSQIMLNGCRKGSKISQSTSVHSHPYAFDLSYSYPLGKVIERSCSSTFPKGFHPWKCHSGEPPRRELLRSHPRHPTATHLGRGDPGVATGGRWKRPHGAMEEKASAAHVRWHRLFEVMFIHF